MLTFLHIKNFWAELYYCLRAGLRKDAMSLSKKPECPQILKKLISQIATQDKSIVAQPITSNDENEIVKLLKYSDTDQSIESVFKKACLVVCYYIASSEAPNNSEIMPSPLITLGTAESVVVKAIEDSLFLHLLRIISTKNILQDLKEFQQKLNSLPQNYFNSTKTLLKVKLLTLQFENSIELMCQKQQEDKNLFIDGVHLAIAMLYYKILKVTNSQDVLILVGGRVNFPMLITQYAKFYIEEEKKRNDFLQILNILMPKPAK